MIVHCIAWVARALVLAFSLVALAGAADAQPRQPAQPKQPQQQQQQQQPGQPSATAVGLAIEILVAKGAQQIYEPIVPGLIDRARGVFLQQNPMLGRDLNEVAGRLRAELAPRGAELMNEAAKLYAASFTEQELRDVLAFYKSPLGKKVITEEPAILDKSVQNIEAWASKLGDEVMAKFRAEMKKKGHDL
jgi:uncharacterized protein